MLPNYRLAAAIRGGCLHDAKDAIEEGADPNGIDLDKVPMLSLCEKHNANEIARLLVEKGAEISRRDPSTGDSLLHQAVRRDNLGFASMLLDAGVSPNVRNAQGQTPLHLVACSGHQYLALMLLKRGADPNLRDKQNHSVFDEALRCNQPIIVRTLGRFVELSHCLFESNLTNARALFNAMRPHLSSWDQDVGLPEYHALAERVQGARREASGGLGR